jgi:Zn-dependent protease with chaperone function
MDFFAHQDEARKNSRRFVYLYSGAVVTICIAVGVLFAVIALMTTESPPEDRWLVMAIFGGSATAISALVILGGSAYRISDLRGGGSSVARGLGGILISPGTRDPDERRVLNVVEEMAIASGVPVPPVYMMPNERRINAFAAGYAPGDAVIGVTRGCVEGLTRDELQGVMAHEFSHILNGDMRLNIRMIGFLNGILIITIAGRILFEVAPRTGRSKEGLGVMLAMFLVAMCLVIIGAAGALSARIIQSAVSRQREYLADASAVQFTRNPDGIANALRRIGGSAGGKIRHPRVEEASHMFFSQAKSLSATLATHPPLKERIKRVLPGWDGSFLDPITPSERREANKKPDHAQQLGDRIEEALGGVDTGVETLLPLLALSGMMTPKHIEHAKGLIESIPANLREAAHDPYTGRAVIYALLLDRKDADLRNAQLRRLETNGDPSIAKLVRSLSTEAVGLKRDLRLPLLDMTLGALAHLSDEQHVTFRKNVEVLVKMDKSIDLFEWVTMNTLKRHLDERFGLAKPVPVQYHNLKRLGREVSVLLSMLAYTGAKDEYDAGEALLMGESAVQGIGVELLPQDQANMRDLDKALDTLNQCNGRVKKQLLQAAALVVGADHKVTTNEAELLRAVADSLGVPTPPLLPGQKLV